ncbi:long-chain acyl-CoA synthetase [Nakamurella panacisegetis]|uniref:Long-chain acyl-CoA synthetase n=1 Tax=Nakamurella panacisegetis TaxID=1090615 RepID=A0A1H0LL42_9ACTN|nr:long-chain-fatty-acid--CoA ligase [Nakamurella panacisegetis]SDO68958.1 long-chain acyl-CoA synthetase [Nakamurella panacisegetis]
MVTPDRPWLASYPDGVPPTVDVPEQSLVDLLDESVERFRSKVALDFFGATTTYAEFGTLVARGAEALRRLGVERGDRVALVIPNCPQHVVAFYAALRLGAIVVEHNPLYKASELQVQLADHGARVVIAWDKVAPLVQQTAANTDVRTVVSVDLTRALPRLKRWALRLPIRQARARRTAMTAPAPGTLHWARLLAAAGPIDPAHPRPGPDDVALLQYTGGTTGTPKGAILTHRNLRANAAQGRAWVPGLRDGGETIYAVLPLFHAYGLTLCLTFAISIGAALVLFPNFDVGLVLDAVRRRPPTFLPGVPPMYERLAHAALARGVDLSSVRFAISGAMALPPATVQLWEQTTGGLLVEGYGMTEASPIALGNPISTARRPGMVGLPFPSTDVRVVDPKNPEHDRAPGEPGELLLRGPQVFSGYWQRPDDTVAAFAPGGWLRTGDIVVMDADGFVTVVDRIKELIITGGFNVYPSEVEKVLCAIPGVQEAAAVGLPSPNGGEEVVAAVVLDAGAGLDESAIREASRGSLASYKVPRRVIIVDQLPHSLIGKILHREVRHSLLSGSEPPLAHGPGTARPEGDGPVIGTPSGSGQ